MADDAKKQILKAEATLLRLPIFALAVKGSATLDGFEFRFTRRRGERTVDSIVRTERDEKTPYPGPLARRVHMAILEGEEEIFLSETQRLEERFNGIPLFIRPKSFFQTNPAVVWVSVCTTFLSTNRDLCNR